MTDVSADPKELLVPITSDKGMCGSVNSSIYRNVRDYIIPKNRENIQIFSIGVKGATAFKRPMKDLLKIGISEVSTPYNYPTIMAMAENIN